MHERSFGVPQDEQDSLDEDVMTRIPIEDENDARARGPVDMDGGEARFDPVLLPVAT